VGSQVRRWSGERTVACDLAPAQILAHQPGIVWQNRAGHMVDTGQRLGDRDSTCGALGDLDAYVGNLGQPDEVWFSDSDGWPSSARSHVALWRGGGNRRPG
jgi:hypothetical protein